MTYDEMRAVFYTEVDIRLQWYVNLPASSIVIDAMRGEVARIAAVFEKLYPDYQFPIGLHVDWVGNITLDDPIPRATIEYKELVYFPSMPERINRLKAQGWKVVSSVEHKTVPDAFLVTMERDITK